MAAAAFNDEDIVLDTEKINKSLFKHMFFNTGYGYKIQFLNEQPKSQMVLKCDQVMIRKLIILLPFVTLNFWNIFDSQCGPKTCVNSTCVKLLCVFLSIENRVYSR